MNSRYQGPAVLPPAAEVRKKVGAHLESLPGWDQKRSPAERKKEPEKARKQRKRS